MKGGLGPHDGDNIGIQGKMSFIAPKSDLENFKDFIFGSLERAEKWIELLTLCHTKGVPVYIITNGSKIGIVRTLQLLEMDHLIKEVLCIRKDITVNPTNKTGLHNFGIGSPYTSKFEVIKQIMEDDEGIRCEKSDDSPCQCIFVDDDVPHNSEKKDVCLNVEILDAKQSKESKESGENKTILEAFRRNYFAILFLNFEMFTREMYKLINIIPLERITHMYTQVSNGTCKILFLDCDGTLFISPGAMPLHSESRIKQINNFENVELIQITR